MVRGLELPPGYYVERSKAETCLMDPGGRRMISLPASVASRSRDEEPTQEEWRALCRGLLVRLSAQSAECERLRIHAAGLEARVEAAEAERDQANAIAEDLYGFFRRRVREVVDHRTNLERRTTR